MHNRFEDVRIHEFYERFNRELSRMSEEERRETQLELRQHLDELLSAHLEAGLSETEAVEGALGKFGDPTMLGRRMFEEWQETRNPRLYAFGYSFACISGAIIANLVLLLVATMTASFLSHPELILVFQQAAAMLMGASIIVIAGPMAGRKLGRSAVRGMSQASVLGLVCFALLSMLSGSPEHPTPFEAWGPTLFVVFYVFAQATMMAYAFSRPRGSSTPRRST